MTVVLGSRERSAGRAGHLVDLLWVLVARNVKLRYRGSVLGVAWSQLGPLSVIAVMAFVFSRVVKLHIAHYPVFVFVGMLSWTWFQGALLAATESVLSGRDLVRRPGFPSVVLPVAEIATHLVYFVLSLPVLVAAMAVSHVPVRPTFPAVALVVAVQFLLVLGPSYLLAGLQVRFRDTGHLVTAALMPLFYVTPVFYSLASIPHRYRSLYSLNPLTWVIDSYRKAILLGQWPDLRALAVVAAAAAGVGALGVRWFSGAAHRMAEEL